MIDNFTEMIANSLGLREPWYVEGAEFSPEKQEVHIYVNVRPEATFACPSCGSATVRNGYEPTARVLEAWGLPVLSRVCPLQAPPREMSALRHDSDQRAI